MANPLSGQDTQYQFLQGSVATPATVNGAGLSGYAAGYLGSQVVDIQEVKGGTATVTIMGKMRHQGPWVLVGYQQVDGVVSPVRSVSPIAVTARSYHVYQILDPYRDIQAWVSSISSAGVIVCLQLWP